MGLLYQLDRPRTQWEDNINPDRKEDEKWTRLTLDCVQWRPLIFAMLCPRVLLVVGTDLA